MAYWPHNLQYRYLLYSGKIWPALNLANWLSVCRYCRVWHWQSLNLAIWILGVIGAHAILIIYICKFLIWWSLPNSTNHQIKNLAKVPRYMVLPLYIDEGVKKYHKVTFLCVWQIYVNSSKWGLLINVCDVYLCILAFYALQHMAQINFMQYKFMRPVLDSHNSHK